MLRQSLRFYSLRKEKSYRKIKPHLNIVYKDFLCNPIYLPKLYRNLFLLLNLECSTNCTLKNGKSPPEMKFKMIRKTATLKSTIALNCRLCHSNPPPTIHWFFNGRALNFQGKRMHLLNQTSSCQQTLYLLTVLNEDEGNYTCVARNRFGEANSTTEITIFGE